MTFQIKIDRSSIVKKPNFWDYKYLEQLADIIDEVNYKVVDQLYLVNFGCVESSDGEMLIKQMSKLGFILECGPHFPLHKENNKELNKWRKENLNMMGWWAIFYANESKNGNNGLDGGWGWDKCSHGKTLCEAINIAAIKAVGADEKGYFVHDKNLKNKEAKPENKDWKKFISDLDLD